MINEIKITGRYRLSDQEQIFTGKIIFQEYENSIYYTWKILDDQLKLIASKSLNVDFRRIPAGRDFFEFSKKHAVEGIRKYRIGRKKIIVDLEVI